MSSAPAEHQPIGSVRIRGILGFRLGLWYSGFFVGATLLILILAYGLLAWSLRQRDHEVVRLTLADYAALYESDGLEGLRRAISTQHEVGSHPDLFVRVITRDGEAIFLSAPGRWAPFDSAHLVDSSASREPAWSILPGRADNAVLEVAAVRFDDGTVLEVGVSSKPRAETLARFRHLLMILIAVALVIGVGVGTLLTRWTVRPIRDLERTVQTIISTGALGERVPVRPSGEALDDLAALMNRMLDRMERLVGGMREALDAVAHDLRTPLMRVRAIAEGAAGSCTQPESLDALERILEETDRLAAMLASLMDIAEAEAGTMRLEPVSIEADRLIQDAVDLYADLAEERGVELRTSAPPGLCVWVDPNRGRQVLANLLDNALKYSGPDGAIDVAAAAEGKGVALAVTDGGPGIPSQDLPRVWDRLYRADRSRSERGLGLGLSLVKAVVLAHGGRVGVTSEPGKGTRFQVWLPSPPPSAPPTVPSTPPGDLSAL